MAENITLILHEQDQERLDKLAEVRKDKAVWEHQRKYEQSKREYLGEDVLKDTGSAVVWWLAKNDDHVEKTVADLGLLAQLTSAANDTDIPEQLQDLFSEPSDESTIPGSEEMDPKHTFQDQAAEDHLADFFDAMGFTDGDPRRAMVAKQISTIVSEQNQHETAENLLRRFDPPTARNQNDGEEPNPHDTDETSLHPHAPRRRL